MDRSSYLKQIISILIIYSIILLGSLYLSQSFIDSNIITISNITTNNTLDQALNDVSASSIHKLPPDSEINVIISLLIGFLIGIFLLFVLIKYIPAIFIKLFYAISLWIIADMFFSILGYTLIGNDVFNMGLIIGCISIIPILAWIVYPEWWVVNIIVIMMSITFASFIGSSLQPPFIILLLIGLSIYDYIAVLKSGFMMKFAKNAMSIQLPAAAIIPYKDNISFIKNGINLDHVKDKSDRNFMLLGTGDFVFPILLAVSASSYMTFGDGFIIGIFILISYVIMMYFMIYSKYSSKFQALPGLPFLCTGSIIGYIITILI